MAMNKTELCDHFMRNATEIRNSLIVKSDNKYNPIDKNLSPIPPFYGTDDIKLIIIGQDPTIRNKEQRSKITITLNLKTPGSLLRYIQDDICSKLGISIENVYATDLFKYFYTKPPADTPRVLLQHFSENLKLLIEEINIFPGVPIITLGEPILKLLANELKYQKVRFHWDYDKNTGNSNHNFRYCPKEKNKLGRVIFPFPHQPSLRKNFYQETFPVYLNFMKLQMKS